MCGIVSRRSQAGAESKDSRQHHKHGEHQNPALAMLVHGLNAPCRMTGCVMSEKTMLTIREYDTASDTIGATEVANSQQ
jgi:hypothetical protein